MPHIRSRTAFLMLASAMACALAMLLVSAAAVRAQSSESVMTGYAWSDTIGWMDLHCDNTDSCASNDFGITVAQNGDLSGYAWSEHIGWVSANQADLGGCPSGACKAKVSGNKLQGWMRALAADGDGWDGWISLSGSGYGPTLSNGEFSGYAWGSDVVGWVDFSLARTGYNECTPSIAYACVDESTIAVTSIDASCQQSVTYSTCEHQCSNGACAAPPPPSFNEGANGLTGHLQIRPALVPRGFTTRVYWDVSGVESCSVTGTNGDSWSGVASGSTGRVSGVINQQTLYTLTCEAYEGQTFDPETAFVNIVPIFQEL